MHTQFGKFLSICTLAGALALGLQAAAHESTVARTSAQMGRDFRLAHDASRAAKEPLSVFLKRSLEQTSVSELEAIGRGDPGWTRYGSEPVLYKVFVFDSAFESKLDLVLDPLEQLLQRVPALRELAPWQSLLARAQLAARQPQAALMSAQRAFALDGRLCGDDCPSLTRRWLDTGKLPAPAQWPAIPTPAVYNLSKVECEAAPASLQKDPLAWEIPVEEMLDGVLGAEAQIAWLVREQWRMQLVGCNRGSQMALQQAIDRHYPAIVVQQSWQTMEAALSARPASLVFLGQTLPLPAQECDFAVDASCKHAFKALSVATARTLAENLRSLSQHLSSPGQCPAPEPGDENYVDVQRGFRAQFRSIEQAEAKAALPALRTLLSDSQWQILWRSEVPYEVREKLQEIAREGGEAAQALQFAQSWIDAGTLEMRQSASVADLLAVLLLRNRRPEDALLQLRLAQIAHPQKERNLRITQLQAALAGADLDAGLPVALIPRPWLIGKSKSDRAVSAAIPTEVTFSLDGVQLFDILYAIGGEQVIARRQLKVQWLPWLLGWDYQSENFGADLRKAYGPQTLQKMFDQAVLEFSSRPKAGLIVDGIVLPLPDQYCADEDCEVALPMDPQWVRERLQALFEAP